MKKVTALFALVFVLLAIPAIAGKVRGPQEFDDKVYIRDSNLYLNNTAVSATAAELNILDGVTATADEINRLDGGMPASNLTAGTIPASAGAIGLGTNVSLRGVSVPLSGGVLTLGSNVVLSAVQDTSTTAGPLTLGTNVILSGVSVSATGGPIALGSNVTATAANLSAPVFSETGGAIAFKSNMNWAATGGAVTLPTNVVPSGGVSGQIDATTVVSVVNGVITGLGL